MALAHPGRRAIVERLSRGPATVGEATRGLSLSKPAVTKHVKLLESAGVVRREVVGRTHRLRLDPRPIAEAEAWIARHRAVWESKFEAVDRFLTEQS